MPTQIAWVKFKDSDVINPKRNSKTSNIHDYMAHDTKTTTNILNNSNLKN